MYCTIFNWEKTCYKRYVNHITWSVKRDMAYYCICAKTWWWWWWWNWSCCDSFVIYIFLLEGQICGKLVMDPSYLKIMNPKIMLFWLYRSASVFCMRRIIHIDWSDFPWFCVYFGDPMSVLQRAFQIAASVYLDTTYHTIFFFQTRIVANILTGERVR